MRRSSSCRYPEQAHQRPANSDRCAADAAKTEVKRGNAAGQNTNDRKRDRIVRESRHAAQQLLSIPEALESLHIFGDQIAFAAGMKRRICVHRGRCDTRVGDMKKAICQHGTRPLSCHPRRWLALPILLAALVLTSAQAATLSGTV